MSRLRARALATYVFMAALAFAARARAQRADELPAPSTGPIERAESLTGPVVSVRIASPLRGEDPWERVGLSRGAAFSAERARDALRHALATGTFASASISAAPVAGGVELIVRGDRRFRLTDFNIVGAAARDAEITREDADLHPDMTVTDASVADALRRVVDAYRDAGFPEAQCSAEWTETDVPGARGLTFRIVEGRALRTRAVEFTGVAASLQSAALESVGLRAGDLAAPQRLRVGEENLATRLRREGYLDARVTSTAADLPGGGVRVLFEVAAGRRYVIAWHGVYAVPEASLVASLRMSEEQGFTESTLASFCARVQDFYGRRGWYDARVRAELETDTPDERVVRFRVVEGRQVFVRALTFRGATVLSERELTDIIEDLARSTLPNTPRVVRGVIHRAHVHPWRVQRRRAAHRRDLPRARLFRHHRGDAAAGARGDP